MEINIHDLPLVNQNLNYENSQDSDNFFNIFKCSFEQSKRYATEFETDQRNLSVKHCLFCDEINLEMIDDNVCARCSIYPNPSQLNLDDQNQIRLLNPFSSLNNMNPGEIPDCLKGLSLFEQTLIARAKPFIYVIKFNRRQYHYSNQVISFNQDIQELIRELPHAISTLSSHLIIRKENVNPNECPDIRVRREVVKNALEYLIQHNRHYHNIVQINYDNLNSLPEDNSIQQHLTHVLEPDANIIDNDEQKNINQEQNFETGKNFFFNKHFISL